MLGTPPERDAATLRAAAWILHRRAGCRPRLGLRVVITVLRQSARRIEAENKSPDRLKRLIS